MKKSTNKTKPEKMTITSYLATIEDAKARSEAKVLLKLFKEVTGVKPAFWGNIAGFGSYHYKYDSGREGDFLATGFAMRKSGPTIYILPGYNDYSDMLKHLGPHKIGKSCLNLKSLEGIDLKVLEKLVRTGLKDLAKIYPVVMK